ncbi:MAG: hypothetical protein ACRD26_24050 [Vicinamibacterales bacterium]
MQPALVLALELAIQDNTIDVGAPFQQTRLALFAGAVDLQAVLQFALALTTCVERLLVPVVAVSMALQQAPAFRSGPPRDRGNRSSNQDVRASRDPELRN